MAILLTMRVDGHLDAGWSDWFEGLEMHLLEDGSTELFGPVVDQAALHGLLSRARDLGLTMLSVTAETTDEDDKEEINQ